MNRTKYSKKESTVALIAIFVTFLLFPIGVSILAKFVGYSIEGNIQNNWDYVMIFGLSMTYIISALLIFLAISAFIVEGFESILRMFGSKK